MERGKNTHCSIERRALTSILSVSSLLRRGLIARASSGEKSFAGASVGASRGMIMVPLDLRWVRRGRLSLPGLLCSSVSVEVLEVPLEAGGVGRVVLTSRGFAVVMDGIEEA